MTPWRRLVAAAGCFSAWLALLLMGHPLGPWVHLLGAAALFCFPWRAAWRLDEEDS